MPDLQGPFERETRFSSLELKKVQADGAFEGYASLFGKEDLGRDIIMPGAFRDSISLRGPAGIKLLFQHDPAEPIGLWREIREDNAGLFVRGQLMQDVARAREILSLMRAGALDGLSIGFRTEKGRTDPKTGIRRIEKLDLWEISIVTFPMLPEARVSAVKNVARRAGIPTRREFERWLTQDAGLSRSQARAVIRDGFKSLSGMQDADGRKFTTNRALAATIRKAAQSISNTR